MAIERAKREDIPDSGTKVTLCLRMYHDTIEQMNSARNTQKNAHLVVDVDAMVPSCSGLGGDSGIGCQDREGTHGA